MASFRAPCLALLALLCVSFVHAEVEVCYLGSADEAKCKTALEDAYGTGPGWKCVKGSSSDDCLQKVREGDAHVTVVGGGQLFAAHNQYNLAAIVGESADADLETASYYGVGITHRDNCESVDGTATETTSGTITGMDASLKSKHACHTGYRKTAGWFLPVGRLLSNDAMSLSTEEAKEKSVRVDAETVREFWSGEVCAPRWTSYGPTTAGGELFGEVATSDSTGGGLCKRCANTCREDDAGENDDFAGYEGAIRCINYAGDSWKGGDIAFVKHSTIPDYEETTLIGGGALIPKSEYVGICDKGCKKLYNDDGSYVMDGDNPVYETCSNGKSAANAMVSTKNFVNSDDYDALMTALSLGGAKTTHTGTAKDELEKEDTYGIWSEDTVELYKLSDAEDDAGFKDFFTAYENFRELQNSDNGVGTHEVKVCVPYNDATLATRCNDVMNAQYGDSTVRFTCLNGETSAKCQQGISDSTYDMTTFGGNELFVSHKDFGLEALVAEVYGGTDEPASYFGVGIVKASQCGTGDGQFTGKNSASLEGKDSCHTGYRKTAGWYLPVGDLLATGIMPTVQDPEGKIRTDAYSTSQFFGRVCAPRTTSFGPAIPAEGADTGGKYDALCDLCGDATGVTDKCSGQQDVNPYADYTGAFKCMVDGDNRIAWVKQTTPVDYNEENPDNQVTIGEYRLLCESGCQEIKEANWKKDECNSGTSASQAVVVRAGFKDIDKGAAVLAKLKDFKIGAQEIGGQNNFFWSASTESVLDVTSQDFKNDFFKAYDGFEKIFGLTDGDGDGDGNSASFLKAGILLLAVSLGGFMLLA